MKNIFGSVVIFCSLCFKAILYTDYSLIRFEYLYARISISFIFQHCWRKYCLLIINGFMVFSSNQILYNWQVFNSIKLINHRMRLACIQAALIYIHILNVFCVHGSILRSRPGYRVVQRITRFCKSDASTPRKLLFQRDSWGESH